MTRLYKYFLILAGLIFIGTESHCQLKNDLATNNDSLYLKARELAFNGKKAEARKVCKTILLKNNLYFDAYILMGRTYLWDNQYDSARIALNKVLQIKNQYYDAIDAMIDLEYWSEDYEACLKQSDLGLSFYSNDNNFLLKKAKALIALNQYDKAHSILKEMIKQDSSKVKEAKEMLNKIKLAEIKNKVSLGYTLDYFENSIIDPWHITYLQYSRKTNIGLVIGRLNYANRFREQGIQFEVDAYPKLTKSTYLYLNVGYSNYSIFPEFRGGAELYVNLPKAFETSIGFRYLSFTSTNVFIYTASAGKYLGDYWLSARTFITPDENGTSISGILQTRRYFSDADNYLGLKLNYGNSPDDRTKIANSASVLNLKSGGAGLSYNKKIKQFWIVNFGVSYEIQEYNPSKYRNVYSGDITLTRLF